MKIFRGPRSTDNWTQTDSKSLREWAKDWWPGKKVRLDGTIDKTGLRHTDLGIQIDSDEILALHDALVRYHKSRIKGLEKKNEDLQETVDVLAEALRKIHLLASLYRTDAPNDDVLLSTIRQVAEHFRWSHSRSKPINLGWIKWKDL